MTLESKKLLDETGRRLLEALQSDGRLSFSELGRRVGLTSPAVAERMQKMEEAGIITGYRVQVNLEKIGFSVIAMVGLTTTPDRYSQVLVLVRDMPEVLECHHVTGNFSFVIKVMARSIAHLEEAIAQLSRYGQTTTSIVLSSPVKTKKIYLSR